MCQLARLDEPTKESVTIISLGKLGDTQLGPIYLGTLGVFPLITGLLAFVIIGMNMLASVNWDRPNLSAGSFGCLWPPRPKEYGLSIPPLKMVVGG
ncbi:MAG: hypothetical protein CM15mP103_03160 [Gammaproteobacteria bacterium]|nr:MAG: hypothetical protein CM15mP103_03160 [Gammaproteobacteria bacterium]